MKVCQLLPIIRHYVSLDIHKDVQLRQRDQKPFPKPWRWWEGKEHPLLHTHRSFCFCIFQFLHPQTSKLSFSANNDGRSLGDRCQKHLLCVSCSLSYYSSSTSSVSTCLHFRQILSFVLQRSLHL